MSPIIVASCPGKVCIVGGYAMLEPGNRGLVLATEARIRASLKHEIDPASEKRNISVYSKSLRGKYTFSYELNGTVHVHPDSPKNRFVEYAIRCALLLVIRRLNLSTQQTEDGTFHVIPSRILNIILDTDECFAFNGTKTGIGSSAGITASLVGAVLLHFYSTSPLSLLDIEESGSIRFGDIISENSLKKEIHFVAQLAHSFAQEKIGSGFDVCCAVFGSGIYSRFSPDVLNDCAFESDSTPNQSLIQLFDQSLTQEAQLLDYSFHSTPVPAHRLFLLVSSDSTSTTDMVSRFTAKKDLLGDLYTSLVFANGQFISLWENADLYEKATDTFRLIRCFLKDMGNICGIPIEPEASTHVLNDISGIDGVICAGCPGSGGYDAMFVLTADICDVKELLFARIVENYPSLTPLEVGIDQRKGLCFDFVDILQ